MTEDFSFIAEEKLLTAEEWQHLDADDGSKEVVQGENEEEEIGSAVTSLRKSCREPSPKNIMLMRLCQKIKAVTLAQLHPTSSLKTISNKMSRLLESKTQLWRWK
jgi:L-lactate utilization protein LutB